MRSLVADARQDTLRNQEIKERAKREVECGQADWLLKESLDLLDLSSPSSPLLKSVSGAGASFELSGDQKAEVVAEVIESSLRDDFPRHISQLDQCNHLLIKYEPELDPTHPGYHDKEYRERRKKVAEIAFNYRHGQRIPEVEYEQKELDTWAYIYERLKRAYSKYACRQHNEAIEELERECGYSANSIPQLQKVSDFLERKTGWRLRPAAGLMTARDFLASLAFRVFQTTQYIRHWGNPEHSVEPDCIHELMGHIPMLCDPEFARFSQELGIASLGASDEQIERFATLYWFTVEFGLCREGNELKCYGAGLLSSYGEMEHALESNVPTLKEFVPEKTAIETYDDSEYQVTYYVAESFEDAKEKMKQYAARHLDRDFELIFDPYRNSIVELRSLEELDQFAQTIQADVGRLSSAITKLRDYKGEHKEETNIIASMERLESVGYGRSKQQQLKHQQNGIIQDLKNFEWPVEEHNGF